MLKCCVGNPNVMGILCAETLCADMYYADMYADLYADSMVLCYCTVYMSRCFFAVSSRPASNFSIKLEYMNCTGGCL